MSKDFSKWHKVKSRIDDLDSSSLYFKERDIWWCHIGENVGFEQDGKGKEFVRPVLVFKKINRDTCLVIPLSLKVRRGNFYFFLLSESNIVRTASLAQMKMIDVKRLKYKLDSISQVEFNFIKEKIIALIR